jgi:ligand-binding sensor domain-containing protein
MGPDTWTSYTSQDFDLGWGGVADLLVDSSGQVWVATLGGGLSLWDGQRWSYYRTSNSPLPYNTVQEIVELSPGIFWICSSIPNESGGVVTRFAGQDWRTYKPILTGYPGSEALAVAQDSLGRLWFGTRTSGVVIDDEP